MLPNKSVLSKVIETVSHVCPLVVPGDHEWIVVDQGLVDCNSVDMSTALSIALEFAIK